MDAERLTRLDSRTRGALAGAVADFESRLGSDLLAAILYGSAAGSTYLPGRSDLNVLLLVTRVNLESLTAAHNVAQRWRRYRLRPLLMTPADLRSSLDVFAVEFADLQHAHVVLRGEAPFAGLTIHPDHLRLQCEAELKRHLMKFRNAVVAGGTGRSLDALLAGSITGLLPVWKALLRLLESGPRWPEGTEVIARVAVLTGVDPAPFREALALKRGERRPRGAALRRLADAYLSQLGLVIEAVDRLKTHPA